MKSREYRCVYLDHQATTPVDPAVLEAMLPYFTAEFGNAASAQHLFGATAAAAVETARGEVAALLGAHPTEVVFTSGATESNNLAIQGVAAHPGASGQIVTASTEHRSVLDTVCALRERGFPVLQLPVDSVGFVDMNALENALRTPTLLVSIMAANNEIGTLAPVRQIAAMCESAGALFHCDATQLVGKLPLDVHESGIHLVSLSGHKMYGPKGIGALYVHRDVQTRVSAVVFGGGHERGLRSGTLNVPGCVGLGAASQIASQRMGDDGERLRPLSAILLAEIKARVDDVAVLGHPTDRLPGNLNLFFHGVVAEDLMLMVPEVAMASGSACSAASPEPSHVLQAIGLNYEDAQCCVRLGVGRFTTEDDVRFAAERIADGVLQARDVNRVVAQEAAP